MQRPSLRLNSFSLEKPLPEVSLIGIVDAHSSHHNGHMRNARSQSHRCDRMSTQFQGQEAIREQQETAEYGCRRKSQLKKRRPKYVEGQHRHINLVIPLGNDDTVRDEHAHAAKHRRQQDQLRKKYRFQNRKLLVYVRHAHEDECRCEADSEQRRMQITVDERRNRVKEKHRNVYPSRLPCHPHIEATQSLREFPLNALRLEMQSTHIQSVSICLGLAPRKDLAHPTRTHAPRPVRHGCPARRCDIAPVTWSIGFIFGVIRFKLRVTNAHIRIRPIVLVDHIHDNGFFSLFSCGGRGIKPFLGHVDCHCSCDRCALRGITVHITPTREGCR
eukprot:Opistho-2@43784